MRDGNFNDIVAIKKVTVNGNVDSLKKEYTLLKRFNSRYIVRCIDFQYYGDEAWVFLTPFVHV